MGAATSVEGCISNIAKGPQQPLLAGHDPEAEPVFDNLPHLLHVRVPKGPTWTSGLYWLVQDQKANGYPLWKASHAEAWLYSMTSGKWGIGGVREHASGFQAIAAFVFCDHYHFGEMPNHLTWGWMHNQPAWTLDRQIFVEQWPETMTVVLTKATLEERYGIHTRHLNAGEDNALVPTLRLWEVAPGSLLDTWNRQAFAAGRRVDIVAVGSDVVRVGRFMDPSRMQQALLMEQRVEVEFRRPRHRPRRRSADACGAETETSGDSGASRGSADSPLNSARSA